MSRLIVLANVSMNHPQWLRSYPVSTLVTIASVLTAHGAIAQTLPACQPPSGDELLVLVLNETPQTSTQLEQTLPPNTRSTVCNYLGREVTRVAGFTEAETASTWAQYLSEMQGLQAFVARPPDPSPAPAQAPIPTVAPSLPPAVVSAEVAPPEVAAPTVSVPALPDASTLPPTVPPDASVAALMGTPTESEPTPVPPTTVATSTQTAPTPPSTGATTAYNPQPLGTGYAVLVDYANRPEVAIEVQQLLSRPIGLVSYQQRPFLLAIHTDDAAIASDILKTLSDQNLTAVIVDSRSAVLLTPVVAVRE